VPAFEKMPPVPPSSPASLLSELSSLVFCDDSSLAQSDSSSDTESLDVQTQAALSPLVEPTFANYTYPTFSPYFDAAQSPYGKPAFSPYADAASYAYTAHPVDWPLSPPPCMPYTHSLFLPPVLPMGAPLPFSPTSTRAEYAGELSLLARPRRRRSASQNTQVHRGVFLLFTLFIVGGACA
jgi:hypothetical protein